MAFRWLEGQEDKPLFGLKARIGAVGQMRTKLRFRSPSQISGSKKGRATWRGRRRMIAYRGHGLGGGARSESGCDPGMD